MKFLCENCRAKYQIADEKVAGRNVRMKCRKCGHLIEVEASVTEASTVTKSSQAPARSAAPPSAGTPQPAAAAPRTREARPAPKPEAPPAAPGGAKHTAREAKPRPATAAAGGLAGAFSKAVVPKVGPSAVSAALSVLSSRPDIEEWYVGVNGVPVGPVRLSELRRKATSGAITPESLVWREGFEEWVPLRTFPELLTMFKEAASASRASLTPTPPPPSRSLAGAPRPAAVGLPPRALPTPRPVAPAAGRAAPSEAPHRASAGSLEQLTVPAVEESIDLNFEDVGVLPAAPVLPAPPMVEAPSVRAAPAPRADSLRVSRYQQIVTKRLPALAVAVLLLVGVLVGMAILLVLDQRRTPGVQIVSVPTPVLTVAAPTPAAAPATEGPGATTIGAIEIGAAAQKGGAVAGRAKGPDTTTGGAPAAAANTSLSGLGGLVGGPSAPGGASPSGGGGGQLAAADVERVVQSHRAFVKRQCWETALAAKPPNAPSSVRVMVSITVGSDGRVQSTSASGGDAYPGLGSCVQSQVRNWTFPRSDGATVSVPFVFASQ